MKLHFLWKKNLVYLLVLLILCSHRQKKRKNYVLTGEIALKNTHYYYHIDEHIISRYIFLMAIILKDITLYYDYHYSKLFLQEKHILSIMQSDEAQTPATSTNGQPP